MKNSFFFFLKKKKKKEGAVAGHPFHKEWHVSRFYWAWHGNQTDYVKL
jgi:hypothetical protein